MYITIVEIENFQSHNLGMLIMLYNISHKKYSQCHLFYDAVSKLYSLWQCLDTSITYHQFFQYSSSYLKASKVKLFDIIAVLSNSVSILQTRNYNNISTRFCVDRSSEIKLIWFSFKYEWVKCLTTSYTLHSNSMYSRWSKKNTQRKKLTGVTLSSWIIKMC